MTEWIPITEALPPQGEMCVVFSTRADDDDDAEGVDQYYGVWAIRRSLTADDAHTRQWATSHEVTHWMRLERPVEVA